MAAATPVPATPVGAIPEIIENGIHGVLVRPRDAVALADAIDTLIKDRRSLKRMSKACVERARVRYGAARNATKAVILERVGVASNYQGSCGK